MKARDAIRIVLALAVIVILAHIARSVQRIADSMAVLRLEAGDR